MCLLEQCPMSSWRKSELQFLVGLLVGLNRRRFLIRIWFGLGGRVHVQGLEVRFNERVMKFAYSMFIGIYGFLYGFGTCIFESNTAQLDFCAPEDSRIEMCKMS